MTIVSKLYPCPGLVSNAETCYIWSLVHSTLDVARGGAVTVNRSSFLGVDEQQRINWKTSMYL